MAATRKARVPMAEQIRLINECRQSGMTDADWCRENGIAVSTFYNWVSRCRKAAADHLPEQHTASRMHQTNLDNSHTIEVSMNDVTIRISNDADPVLLTRTLRLIRETSC